MKALIFVDMHGNKSALKRIISRAKKKYIDLVICAGDFTIFGESQDLILSRLNKIGKPVLFVHGNHEESGGLRKSCGLFKNCYFIHNRKFRRNNYLFIGWGGGGFAFKDKGLEKNVKKFKRWIKKADKVVFVTHAPPYKTKVDKIFKEHAGNKSIRRFIESAKLEWNVCGHLHETAGKQDRIGKTKIINPGYKGKVILL